MANVVKVPNFKANSNGNTHRHTQTRVCAEDACAACGAANVGGKFAYTAASQEGNFVVFSGTIWLHQRSQRRRRKAGKAKGEWGNAKPGKLRRFF